MKKNPAGKVRAAAFILAITLALAAAAGCVAETEKWNLFDRIAEHIEGKVPESAARIMQRDLYTETVNNVEITVREAGYDGRTLFLQYGFRMLDVDVPLGVRARDVYGDELPEGTDPDSYVDGYLTEDAEELLYEHHVGWWIDGIWINGTELDDMPDGSGQYMTGTEVPGEIVETDFWRLDNVGVFPEGKIRISLPIGEMQDFMDYSRADHPEKFDENGNRKVPEKGMVTFEYDASDILSTLRVIRPERETSLPDVTVKVREIAFSPVMTYITLDLEVNPDALEGYKAENGEGYTDEDGELLWEYGGMDVFGGWIECLQLADRDANVLFPDHSGPSVYSDDYAEFLCPYIETPPEELYLAPECDDGVDMTLSVQLLPAMN